MSVIGYARVSTNEQAEQFDALRQQVARLESAGAEFVLVDIESGRDDDREQFTKLLKLVTSGRIREVLVTRVDRLGRSVISLGQALRLFEEYNVRLRILDAPIDTASPFGWFSFSQMASLSEFESRLLSSRVVHGMDYFRQQKKVAQKLFGYKINEEQKLIIDEELRPIARKIIDMLVDGFSVGSVSKWLFDEHGITFSISGLRHWLNNPGILGHTRYFSDSEHRRSKTPRPPVIHHGTHEALATEAEIIKIQQRFKSSKKVSVKQNRNYPLKGLLKCTECGGGMHRIVTQWNEYVRCNKHYKTPHLCSNKKQARLKHIISQVIDALTKESERIIDSIDTANEPIKESEILIDLQKQLAGLEAMNSRNPAITTAIEDLKNQILLEEARLINPIKKDSAERTELLMALSQATFWESVDVVELQFFLAELIDFVSIDSDGNVGSITFL